MAVIRNVEKWKKEVEKALDSVFETKRISGAIEHEVALPESKSLFGKKGKKTTFVLYDPILVYEKGKKIDEDYAKVYIVLGNYIEVGNRDTPPMDVISLYINGNDIIDILVKNKLSALCRMIKTVTLALSKKQNVDSGKKEE